MAANVWSVITRLVVITLLCTADAEKKVKRQPYAVQEGNHFGSSGGSSVGSQLYYSLGGSSHFSESNNLADSLGSSLANKLSAGFGGHGGYGGLANGLGGFSSRFGVSLSHGFGNSLGGGHAGLDFGDSSGDDGAYALLHSHGDDSDGDSNDNYTGGDEKFAAYEKLLAQAGVTAGGNHNMGDEEANSKIKLILLQADVNRKLGEQKVAQMRKNFGYGTFGYQGYRFPLKTQPFDLGTHHAIDLGTTLDTKSIKDSNGKIKLPVQTVFITKTVGVKIPQPYPVKHEIAVPAPYPVPVVHHSQEGSSQASSFSQGGVEDQSEEIHYLNDKNALGSGGYHGNQIQLELGGNHFGGEASSSPIKLVPVATIPNHY